ncbi:MAG: biotin/lipoyl-binding protein [Firmicutes bacterium]|nr:biotin/lipoyl-binding protein [Bacillota bacterium]
MQADKGKRGFYITKRRCSVAAIFFILASFTFLLTGGGCGRATGSGEQQQPAVVELTALEHRDLHASVTVSGQVSAHAEVKVLAELPGRIEEVYVCLGDKVEKGGLLVRLDSRDQEVQLQQAEAALAAAGAQQAEARAGARSQDLAQARAGLMQAESAFTVASAELERMEALYGEGVVSLQQLEQVQMQYTAAKAGLETAQAMLEKLEAGPTEHTLQVLAAQVSQAQAGVAAAKRQYEKMFLRAPISGKVAAVMAHAGEMAGPGSPAVILVNDDPVYIDVLVDEEQIGYLSPGQEVSVAVPVLAERETLENSGADPTEPGGTGHGKGGEFREPGGLQGSIAEMSPAALAGSRSFQVRVKVPNPQGLLKHGMFARVTLQTRFLQDVPVVPATAVQQRDGRDYIFFCDEGVARAVEVKTGVQQGDMIQVEGELRPLPVIARAPRSLNDGDAVQKTGDVQQNKEAGEGR